MKLKSLIAGFLVAALCFSLGGCKWWGSDDEKKNDGGTGYEVTVYEDGKAAQKFDADSYSTKDDAIEFHLKSKDKAGNETRHAQGTWVVKHREWKPAASEKRYQVSLYNGKEVVGNWAVRGFSTDSKSVLLFPADGSEVVRACGTIVVKELKGGESGKAAARVTVTGSGGDLVTLELSHYRVIGHHLEGQPADGSGYIFIWGKVKVEELK